MIALDLTGDKSGAHANLLVPIVEQKHLEIDGWAKADNAWSRWKPDLSGGLQFKVPF